MNRSIGAGHELLDYRVHQPLLLQSALALEHWRGDADFKVPAVARNFGGGVRKVGLDGLLELVFDGVPRRVHKVTSS